MPFVNNLLRCGAVGATLALAFVPQTKAATDYLSRFDGTWRGGGSVTVSQLPTPVDVSCNMSGDRRNAQSFSLGGTCRAMLLMSREIAANITYDPGSKRYSGTYRGSTSGPATLAGRLKGDTLDLRVTWSKKIYDDNFARMLIKNNGRGAFTMQVVEKIDGKSVLVSNLAFRGR